MARHNRRDDIVKAAERLFTSRRFHEVTLDDVIHAAGVGKGTLYRHFKDKDDLFMQTAMAGFDELCSLLERVPAGNGPFPGQLLNACERVSEFFRKRRPLFQMMQGQERHMHWCKGPVRGMWMVHRKKAGSAVADLLRRGIEQGAIRGDVPTEALASILLGMLRTHARDMEGSLGETYGLGTVVDLFLRGAGTNASGPVAAGRLLPGAATDGGDRT